MGRLVKALGTGIGLASEAIHQSRATKRQASASKAAYVPRSGSSRSSGDQNRAMRDSSFSQDQDGAPSSSRAVDQTGGGKDPSAVAAEYGYDYGYDEDEAIWELDEMAERLDPPVYSEEDPVALRRGGSGFSQTAEAAEMPQPDDSDDAKLRKEARMVEALVRMEGPPPQPTQRLAYPVILPQRRPGNKGRGFVRAYAPALEGCGIGQAVFLRFLKDWHSASKASPWIDVIFVAASIAGLVPSAAAQMASTVVQLAASAAREVQSRHRNSTFLDQANRQLFMPRGLFAMVMAFKDVDPSRPDPGQGGGTAGTAGTAGIAASALGESLIHAERLDVRQTVEQQAAAAAAAAVALETRGGSGSSSRLKKAMGNLRVASGKMYTELELPQAAELVYPDLGRAAEHGLAAVAASGAEQDKADAKTRWRNASKFVSDYLDRRAQAEFEMQHQGSSLSVPASQRKPFTSRYSDPSHPANSGSLMALLTGGVIQGRGADDRDRKRNSRPELGSRGQSDDGLGSQGGRKDRGKKDRGKKDRGKKDRGKKDRGKKGRSNLSLADGLPMAAMSSGSGNQRSQDLYQDQYQQAPLQNVRAPAKSRQGPLKKIMKQDVLYLLIVNLPTDEEVRLSMAELEETMSSHGATPYESQGHRQAYEYPQGYPQEYPQEYRYDGQQYRQDGRQEHGFYGR